MHGSKRISRRTFLQVSGAAAAAAVLGRAAVGAESAPAKRPNIVFLLADQWRARATGYAGDPNVKTPCLDRLAGQSVNFSTAVSVCPVCTPYRAALMTGRYPTSTGMFLNDLYLPDREVCMAEIFAAAGYDTAYIGKWHLDGHGRGAYIPPARRQGFEYWKAAECDHNYPHSHYYTGQSQEKKFWDGYDAFAQTADARQYIRGRAASKKPFLLVVSYGSPHFPHNTAPQRYKDLYPPEKLKLNPNVPAAMRPRVLKELPGYYGHCSAVDECVGQVVQTLAEAGLADDTILVFTSDHGEMMGAQGIAPCTKQVPWDESCRVPLLMRYPRRKVGGGRTIATPINTPDILPTLLGLAGVAVPKSVEGEDLSAVAAGEREDAGRAALYMGVSPFSGALRRAYRAIRTSRYTYVRSEEGPWLMYDNAADPWQMNNLANKPAHAAMQKQLEDQLQAQLKKAGDDFKPRQQYIDKWGYKVAPHGSIGYGAGNAPQSPARK
ncbi:MAG: sulfatase [Planctomycetaceae bacterium]|nr:sulfatase [Planctomycetaceae bacterium]